MLVSVTIFSIVMVMALGALLSLSVADRKAETLKSGIDNLTFALDSMSRAIRTGQNYHCGDFAGTSPKNCPNGSTMLTFLASNGVQTYYQLDTSTGTCGQSGTIGCIERKQTTPGGTLITDWTPITSSDIIIQNVGSLFHVTGALPGSTPDTVQPRAVITISATLPVSTTQNTIVHMQTSVTRT